MTWLPMQSYAVMADTGMPADGSSDASPAQVAVHCHGDVASNIADSTGHAMGKMSDGRMSDKCCCGDCDSSCDVGCASGCAQHVSMAVLSQVDILSIEKVHIAHVSVAFALNGLSYSPPLPPPLV